MNALNMLKISFVTLKNHLLPKLHFIRQVSKIQPSLTKAWEVYPFGLATAIYASKKAKPKITIPPQEKDFDTLIKDGCVSSEMKINELIKILEVAITDTCTKYRSCLKKQLAVLEEGLQKDPTDDFFNKLIPIKEEAAHLKKDFETYKGMVTYVGQLAFNLAFCSAIICNLDSKDYVCNEYFILEKISHDQATENKNIEEQLLKMNMQNIVNAKNFTPKQKQIITATTVLVEKPIIDTISQKENSEGEKEDDQVRDKIFSNFL